MNKYTSLKYLIAIFILAAMLISLAGIRRIEVQATAATEAVASPSPISSVCPHTAEGDGPPDYIYIADTNNHRIQRLNSNPEEFKNPVGSPGSGDAEFNSPQGIASAPFKKLYVADTNNNRIQILGRGMSYKGQFGSFGTGDGQFNGPTGIAIDSDQHVYVLDTGNNRVQKFNLNGNYITQWGSAGSGNGQFNAATGLAVSWIDGAVYVADTGNHRVQKFTSDGVHLATFGGPGSGPGSYNSPSAITVHPLNSLVYVLDTGNSRVQILYSDGSFHSLWGSHGNDDGEFDDPRGITASARFGIFVLDTGNNRIQLFNIVGNFIDKWGSSGNGTGEFDNPMAISSNLRGVELDKCVIQDFDLPGGLHRRVTVYYTTSNGLELNRLPDDDPITGENIYAEKVAEWTETAWTAYFNYNLGEPKKKYRNVDLGGVFGDEIEVWVYDIKSIGLKGHCCGSYSYKISAPHAVDSLANDERSIAETVFHEMFHNFQGSSRLTAGDGEPKWSTEGGATTMQDKVVSSIDSWVGSSYMGNVNYYLWNSYDNDFRDRAYDAALFWTYFLEQLGNGTPPDPGYGMSAMEHYFGVVDPPHGLDAVALAIGSLSGYTRSFENFWTDFTIANFTKDFANPSERYRFVDDNLTPYNSVPVNQQTISDTAPAITFTNIIPAYAARYLEVVPDFDTCSYVAFDMTSDQRVGFSLADHRGGFLVRQPETFWGTHRIIALKVGDVYNSGDGMGAVITGLADQADVSVTASCINPTMEIILPSNGHPAIAGPHDNPGTIVIYVSVSVDGFGPVRGLVGSQFEVSIGGELAPFSGHVELGDLYALVVPAPSKTADGLYDLDISLDGSIFDLEAEAVLYTSEIMENMLVIDRSGSMATDNKLDAAKDAADLQITEMDRNAWSGLVSFATTETLDEPLQDITIEPARSNLRSAVTSLSASDATAIVAGVDQALDEMENAGQPDHACNVTLLTDGMDNQSSDSDVASLITRLMNHDRGCRVYAIALGENADKLLLQDLADASGGKVYGSTLEPPATFAANLINPTGLMSGTLTASWQNRLVSYYDDIAANQAGRKRILAVGRTPFDGFATETITMDNSVAEAVIAINGESPLAQSANLVDPNGTPVDDSYPGATIIDNGNHRVFEIQIPIPGKWEVQMEGESELGYIVMTSAVTPISLQVLAREPGKVSSVGQPVPILAVFHNRVGTLLGATVEADIQDSQGDVTHLRLYDDGQHGDGSADDGVYGNWFTRANMAPCHTDTELGTITICDNIYQVYAAATLNDIRREAQTSFAIKSSKDSDKDGLPDNWERNHGLDPKNPVDVDRDPDDDGLSNYDEFLQGTDPQDPDTDRGGESDGSEVVNSNSNPLDPLDDGIPPLYELMLNPLDGSVVLYFMADKSFDHHRIYRRISPSTAASTLKDPWELIDEQALPTGSFTDTSTSNGVSYQYRLVTVASNNAESPPLDSRSVTSGVDAEPPYGWITINHGSISTPNHMVTLQLGWEPDAVAMRLGNHPDLNHEPWESLSTERSWILNPDLTPGDVAWVYVEFRDFAGNISSGGIADSILLDEYRSYLPLIFCK